MLLPAIRLSFSFLLFVYSGLASANIKIELIGGPFLVSPDGDLSSFATSFDFLDGYVVVANVVEPVERKSPFLKTIVRMGRRGANGVWGWAETIVDARTMRNPWHTQPSIAFDRSGYIHIAYGMHNMPWQYSRSMHPYSVDNFIFRGEVVTDEDLGRVFFDNVTNFSGSGRAEIPGTQITYPAFFRSGNGRLWISYRHSLRPARPWKERMLSAGVSVYSEVSQTWSPVGWSFLREKSDIDNWGASTQSITTFTADEEYIPYLPRLVEDAVGGKLHVVWTWRQGGPGPDSSAPSHSVVVFDQSESPIPKADAKPITRSSSNKLPGFSVEQKFTPYKLLGSLPGGGLFAVFELIGGSRLVSYWSVDKELWSLPQPLPAGTNSLAADKQGRQIAVGRGLRIYKRDHLDAEWVLLGDLKGDRCSPQVKYSDVEDLFYIYSKSCDMKSVSLHRFTF
ncbi:BNR-4 repeat-containing protein [Leptothrix discophora]|uniref:BNR-4 repeat-containing protein n=1 Tax=Leptothrix discophora TaxID=89 RepID=A0ABT9FXW3_LEPDI|nr:BNR-4 repeat-containing protein [Leptothrix discophora]MDP4299064.1 BNR-4 repeat-containing protein [Leptothrix discophora]